ncbi:hypothetical protein SM8_003965 [Streptomyces sp. SM8]|nr:hypothetical protein SM8_003965 [Streptomyces sp. SM8]
MGFLERLRGRRGGTPETPGADSAGPAPAVPSGPVAEASPAPAPVVPSWSGLPPVQLAARAGGAGVADNAFGGTLPTWQNPSFTATASPAVLNPAAGAGLLPGALGTSGTRSRLRRSSGRFRAGHPRRLRRQPRRRARPPGLRVVRRGRA